MTTAQDGGKVVSLMHQPLLVLISVTRMSRPQGHNAIGRIIIIIISNLSNDRSKASSKKIPPHSAIYSFLLQLTVSSPVLKVIQ